MYSEEKSQIYFLMNSLCEGGAERAIVTISKRFVEDGYSVTILALTKNNFYQIPKGVEVIYLSKMNDHISSLQKMLYIPYHAWRLKKYVQKHNIYLIHSYLFRSNFVNLISTIFGSKHITQVSNRSVVSRFFKEGLSGKINLFLIKHLYPRADMVIYNSIEMKSDFHKKLFKPKKERVIYNSFDIDNILKEADEPIEDFTFKSHKRYIVTVGRLIELKLFKDTIEAVSRVDSDIELILLGDGEERESLEELAKDLEISSRIHFLGQVDNPFKYIKKADIFVSSSLVEGFPNVLIEAMLCKTVAICSDCLSGPREILAPNSDSSKRLVEGMELAEFGTLYGVGDINALAKSILYIFSNSSLYYEYQTKAFNRAKEFSVENITSQYREVLLNG